MSVKLPKPIDTYVKAQNVYDTGDALALLRGQTFTGC